VRGKPGMHIIVGQVPDTSLGFPWQVIYIEGAYARCWHIFFICSGRGPAVSCTICKEHVFLSIVPWSLAGALTGLWQW
jgi:hypothetical protein